MRTSLLLMSIALTLQCQAFGGSITDTASLEANSDTSNPGLYLLNPGIYTVDAAVDVANDPRSNVTVTGGTVLNITNGTGEMLTVDQINAVNGAVITVVVNNPGGTGIVANGMTVSGTQDSVVTVQAGMGGNAQGIRILQRGFSQESGQVAVSGGTGASSDGIYIQQGGYTFSDGVLTAGGGTGNNSSGILVAGGGFTMNNGNAGFNGGTGGSASGLLVTGGGFIMNDGSATMQGGDGSNASGVSVNGGGFLMAGGTATVYGGTASNAAGITVSNGDFIMNGGDMTASGGTGGSGNSQGILANQAARQTGGTLTITGGGTSASNGLSARSGVFLSGGSMIVTGGTALSAAGISTNGGTMTVSGTASLDVTAGTASNAYGIFTNYFVQNGGTTVARGAGTGNVHGISGNTFTIGGGAVTAYASDTAESRGVSFGSTTQNGGSITAWGGAYNSGFSLTAGFFSTNLNQTAGEITGYGGSGRGARGMSINNTITQNGDIFAYGGSGETSYGVSAISAWNINGGSLTAEGGSGSRANGAYAPIMRLNAGTMTGTGGSGTDAYGVGGSSLSVVDGTVTGTGGNAGAAYGVGFNSITMESGSISGYAGSASGAHGVDAAALTQESGEVYAKGDATDGSHGVWIGYYYQNGGSLTAVGGSSTQSYGLYVSSTMDVQGRVRLERPDQAAASIFVNGSGLILRTGSVLTPVVNIGDPNGETGSGLIQTAAGSTVTIEGGVSLDPWFIDRRSLLRDIVTTDYVFIDTQGGVIDGIFANERGGLAIEYVAQKINNDSQYVLSYQRVMETPDLIALIPCNNARWLIEALERNFDPTDPLAEEVIQAIEFSRDREELNQIAAHVGRTLTPLTYAKLTGTQLRTMELIQRDFFRQLDSVTDDQARLLASDTGWAASNPGYGWRAWASALYQQSNRFKARCSEFDSPKEELYGVSTGVGRDYGRMAVGGGFSYVRGSYTSGFSDIDIDNYAVTAGVKIHNLAPSGGWLAPWITLAGGYVYGDIDQNLLNYPATGWKSSSPSAHMFRIGAEMGNAIHLGRYFTLSPFAGVDYAYIRQGGYHEHDPAGYGLRVQAGNYNSLRPRVGMELGLRISDRLDFGINAHWRYETLDKKSTFRYSVASSPAIVIKAEGENRKRASGSIGASMAYRLNDRLSLHGNYDLLLEDGYSASSVMVGMGVSF